MESLFKNPIIRNLLAIALGVVIIINPQLGPNIVIMLIGATLAIPALLAIIGYFSYKNKETPMPGYVLVESIGALVIGAWMLLQPTFFNAVILIALGIILLLAGISQIISLIRSGQIMPIPIGMYYSVLSSFGASPFSFTEKSVIPDCTKILYHEINLLMSVG